MPAQGLRGTEGLSPGQHRAVESLTGVARLDVLRRLTTTGSGIEVFLGDVPPDTEGGHSSPHLITLDTRASARNGSRGHAAAWATGIRAYMADLVEVAEPVGKTTAMLYGLAPRAGDNAASLAELLDGGGDRAAAPLRKLGGALAEWNQQAPAHFSTPLGLLREVLGPLLKGKGGVLAVAEREFRLSRELPQVRFQGDGFVLPNPIAYAAREDLWGGAREIAWPMGHCHGWLRTGVVICDATGESDPVLLDFAGYRPDGLAFYDFACLEADVLLRLLPPDTLAARRQWIGTARGLGGLSGVRLSGEGRVGRARRLVGPLREAAARLAVPRERRADFEVAFHVAGLAAGLTFFRQLRRTAPFAGKLALLLAARHLQAVLERVGLAPQPGQTTPELPWSAEPGPAPGRAGTAVPDGGGARASGTAPRQDEGWYAAALAKLGEALEAARGQGSDAYLDFSGHRMALGELWQKERRFGTLSRDQDVDKLQRIHELNKLALNYCGRPLDQLDEARPPEVNAQIENLERTLRLLSRKREVLEQPGEGLPGLDHQIARIEERLAELRYSPEKVQGPAALQVFLSVLREASPARPIHVVGEPITVTVQVRNDGEGEAAVRYRDGLSEGLAADDPGGLEWEGTLAAGDEFTLRYTCRATGPGEHSLYTARAEYEGRDPDLGLDWLPPTPLTARPAHEADLVIDRFYRHTREGMELLVRLRNEGEQAADEIVYEERLLAGGAPHGPLLSWRGRLGGGQEDVLARALPGAEPELLRFEAEVAVPYRSGSRPKICRVRPGCKRVAYDFSPGPETVGPDEEQGRVRALVAGLTQAAGKRLLLVEGTEGLGKTRFVEALRQEASRSYVSCVITDARTPQPVRRALRELSGARAGGGGESVLRRRLEEAFPGANNSDRREGMYRFIAAVPPPPSDQQAAQLRADVLALVKSLARQAPRILVFENLHRTPEALEERILEDILGGMLVSSDIPLLICATYRPVEGGPPPLIGRLQLPRDSYEKQTLKPLDEEQTRRLVDTLITPFPRCSDRLHRAIFARSRGNPLFIIELLRLLTNPEAKWLRRVGVEWELAEDLPSDAVPKLIQELILERAQQELPEHFKFLQMLAVIGLELPLDLVEAAARKAHPEAWTPGRVGGYLSALARAGFVVVGANGEYAFEHEAKATVLYDNLPEADRRWWHERVVRALLEVGAPDGDAAHARRLARHLLGCPDRLKKQHLATIIAAAQSERDLGHFRQSEEYYREALGLAEAASHPLERLQSLYERSHVYQLWGNWSASQRDLEEAQRHLEEANTAASARLLIPLAREWRARLDKAMGHTLLHGGGDRGEAWEFLARAGRRMEGPFGFRRWWLPRDGRFLESLTEINVDLAEISLRQGWLWRCRRACGRALRYARRHARCAGAPRPLLALVYAEFGRLYHEQKHYDEAVRWYDQAVGDARHRGDSYAEERALLALAEVYHEKGDRGRARALYEQAAELQNPLDDHLGLARSYNGLAELWLEDRRFAEARHWCEKARDQQRRVGDVEMLWRCLLRLCAIHLEQGRADEAARSWEEARPILFNGELPARRRVDDLRHRDAKELYRLYDQIADHYRSAGRAEQEYQALKDLDDLALAWDMNAAERVKRKLALAWSCVKTGRQQEALAVVQEANGLNPEYAQLALLHEREGDAYATGKLLCPEPADPDDDLEVHDPAAYHYRQAAAILLDLGHIDPGNINRALEVYDKLLARLDKDDHSRIGLPVAFHKVIGGGGLESETGRLFLAKSEQFLTDRGLYGDAGDLMVYVARALAAAGRPAGEWNEPRHYLRRGEELYRQQGTESVIWGLNLLIPSFQQLNDWGEVLRCFKELFRLYIQVRDEDGFLEACAALQAFEDRTGSRALKGFIRATGEMARSGAMSRAGRLRLLLHRAKFYTHLSKRMERRRGRYKDGGRARAYEVLAGKFADRALALYDRVILLDKPSSVCSKTAWNDSAGIYHGRDNLAEARRRLDHSLSLATDPAEEGTTLHNRALVCLDMEDFEQARADFELALVLHTQAIDRWEWRLRQRDDNPLNSAEVAQLRHTLRSKAFACHSYATFLAGHDGSLSRAHELADEARALFERVGDKESTTRAEKVDSWLALHDQLSQWRAAAKSPGSEGAEARKNLVKLLLHEFLRGPGDKADSDSRGPTGPCPACGRALPDGQTKCPSCDVLLCPKCRGVVERGMAACTHCNAPLTSCARCGAPVPGPDAACPACGAEPPGR